MKKFTTKALAILMAVFLTTSLVACSDDKTEDPITPTVSEELMQSSIDTYTNDIVVNNYVTLATKARILMEKCTTLSTEAEITAACEAWVNARLEWERSEAYLFGPVDAYGIDPGIDSWPLDLASLNQLLVTVSADAFTYKDLMNNEGTLKGFHAIEYVIFAEGAAKTEVTMGTESLVIETGKAEILKAYAVAASTELYRAVLRLEAEWVGNNALSAQKQTDVVTYDVTIEDGNFADVLKTAGAADNKIYKTRKEAISQILQGCMTIADEVGGAKITDPINAEIAASGTGHLNVESWFSWNSIIDFGNNIRGIKAAYIGTRTLDGSPAAGSVSACVKSLDPALDAEVLTAIENAISRIETGMKAPFRNNLTWSAENTAAKNACIALFDALNEANSAIAGN